MQSKGKSFLKATSAIYIQVCFSSLKFFQAIVLSLGEQFLCFVPLFHVHISKLGNKHFLSTHVVFLLEGASGCSPGFDDVYIAGTA